MQHYMAFRDRGVEKLILWYRIGESIDQSVYPNSTITNNPHILAFSPEGAQIHYTFSNGENGLALTYDFNEEGYHNFYIIEKWIEGTTLRIHVAKAERLSHKCSNGHKHERKLVRVSQFNEIPIDIIRHRYHGGENLHLIHQSGDILDFEILINGKPATNADIKITTEKSWTKLTHTDEAGMVSWQLIGDYFSKWKEFNKEATHHFLLTASYTETESGVYESKPYDQITYTSTYGGEYIPSKTWYESNFWALIVFFTALIIFSLAIYIYRWKFKRPY